MEILLSDLIAKMIENGDFESEQSVEGFVTETVIDNLDDEVNINKIKGTDVLEDILWSFDQLSEDLEDVLKIELSVTPKSTLQELFNDVESKVPKNSVVESNLEDLGSFTI